MNKLPLAKRVQILSMLCEGVSMRSISRVVDVSINTVAKMLIDAGEACAAFHDEKVRGVRSKRVQVDEIWSFTAAKQKNVPNMKRPVDGAGDTWTWTALDADSKLIVQWFVGARDGYSAKLFIDDVLCPLTTETRTFATSNLQPGQKYYYTVRAEVNRGGSTVSDTQRVVFQAGQQVSVSFNTFAVADAQRP